MLKRTFDVLFSGVGLLLLFPFFVLIALTIAISSKGGVFYKQKRIGFNGKPFDILKFRSMYVGADKKGLLTVGKKDSRVTPVGYYLRKSKMDELPQLINVFIGDMSLVGPRPEVAKYVDLYSEEDKKVLSVRPGITDYASIQFRNENELLAKSKNPEMTYVEEIMPLKLALNKKYIAEMNPWKDVIIIFKTFKEVLR